MPGKACGCNICLGAGGFVGYRPHTLTFDCWCVGPGNETRRTRGFELVPCQMTNQFRMKSADLDLVPVGSHP